MIVQESWIGNENKRRPHTKKLLIYFAGQCSEQTTFFRIVFCFKSIHKDQCFVLYSFFDCRTRRIGISECNRCLERLSSLSFRFRKRHLNIFFFLQEDLIQRHTHWMNICIFFFPLWALMLYYALCIYFLWIDLKSSTFYWS